MKPKRPIRQFLPPLALLMVLLALLVPIKTQATNMLLQNPVEDEFDGAELVQAANVGNSVDILADLQINEDIAARIPEDVFVYQDIPSTPITINSSTTCGGAEITRIFNVTDSFVVNSITVGFNANHTKRGDISVTLEAPSSLIAPIVVPDSWDSNQNYDIMLGTSGGVLNSGSNDNTGPLYYDRSVAAPLGVFSGLNALGTWTLRICDNDPGNGQNGAYNRSMLLFDTASATCPTATVFSVNSGSWNNPTIWSTSSVPSSTDVVLVNHAMTAPPGGVIPTIGGLCNNGIVESLPGDDLVIDVQGEVKNYAIIKAADGPNPGTGSTCGDPGTNMTLFGSPVYNDGSAGVMRAGDGAPGNQCGGDGGEIYVYGQDTINQGTIRGGDGGRVTGSGPGNGGQGGYAEVWGKYLLGVGDLIHMGVTRGGDGGDGNLASGQIGGCGGPLLLMSRPNVILSGGTARGGKEGPSFGGVSSGCDGWFAIDPDTIRVSGDTQMSGGDITLYGGEDWILNLSNLSDTAIRATDGITLAVGATGVVDLRGNSTSIMQAAGEVTIFADTIELDPGVELSDVIDASEILVKPARILRNVSLVGPELVTVEAGITANIALRLQNLGPIKDTYNLSVSSTALWLMGVLPSSVTVDGISISELTLNVAPPHTAINGDTNTFTVTATSESDPTKVAELKILLTVTDNGAVNLTDVTPRYGLNDGPSTMYIYGQGFSEPLTVTLGPTQTLDVNFVLTNEDPQRIRAVVPAGVTAGTYDITVQTDSGSATLPNAYEVLDSGTTDDLLSSQEWMWTNPMPMRVGYAGSSVGLLVQHLGGTATLDSVTVEFRLDSATGPVLGRSLTNLLAPDAIESTGPVTWEPTEPSNPDDDPIDYTVCAIIDPDNVVAETNEDNNITCRRRGSRSAVTVLPPYCLPNNPLCETPDTEPPEVERFMIDDDTPSTNQQAVRLDAAATDYPNPGASGMNSMKHLEFEYIHGARRWVPVKQSSWEAYDTVAQDHPWDLIPSYGMRYMQAWASDNNQNISLKPGVDVIDLLPTEQADTVGANGVVFYRIFLQEGQRFAATMTPESGDPDMYVWLPDASLEHNVNSTGAETVEFEAPFDGTYQIEIHAPSSGSASYRLTFGASRRAQMDDPVAHSRSNKRLPEEPAVPLDEWPEFYDVGTPPVGTSSPDEGSTIYLPISIR